MGRRRAVCVGLSYFDAAVYGWDGHWGCWGADGDAAAFAALLAGEGVPPVDIVTLRSAEATAEAALSALGAAVRGAEAGDLVVFFFSGHCEPHPEGSRLCFYDRKASDREVTALWAALPAGSYAAAVGDCCNAGARVAPGWSLQAEVVQISAALAGYAAAGTPEGGLFTRALTRVAAAGLPAGYEALRARVQQEIAALSPGAGQKVDLALTGVGPTFAASRPFSCPAPTHTERSGSEGPGAEGRAPG